jgi:hypothetical protein
MPSVDFNVSSEKNQRFSCRGIGGRKTVRRGNLIFLPFLLSPKKGGSAAVLQSLQVIFSQEQRLRIALY